ncbi:MAG TPA: FAD-containing oxidoreductase [Burkholderiales bacterium]|nr:FAD-containing oxidoreductase [Burkholderiales bacterium]
MAKHYDAIIIGTGQAGPALAARLTKEGLKSVIIERGRIGGTCVNTGCIPTKTLVASARVAWLARRAGDFGVMTNGAVQVDMARVKSRMDAVVHHSTEGLEKWLGGMHGLTFIRGHARFTAPDQVNVNDEVLTAPKIFLDVGARAAVPDMPGLNDVKYLTNSGMMKIDFLPSHLIIVGGSYVGLEFAQMYRRFGSRVTVIEMGPRLIGREDDDVSDTVREILEGEGIEVRLNARCIAVAKRGDSVSVRLDCGEGAPEVTGSHLLLAVGRKPNTDDLGLDAAGIHTDKRGHITVDEQLRTSVSGVWALGEVNGRGAFTHTSYNDYEIVAANLFDGAQRRVSDRVPAYALYTDPPLGRAGITEHEARELGRPVLVAKMPMSRVGRARERSEMQGFMKVLVDAQSEHILGAALLGIEGDEVIHCLIDLMYAKASYRLLQQAMHIHPTVSELLPTLLGMLKPLHA